MSDGWKQLLYIGVVGTVLAILSCLSATFVFALKVAGFLSWWGWPDLLLLLPVPAVLAFTIFTVLAALGFLLEGMPVPMQPMPRQRRQI